MPVATPPAVPPPVSAAPAPTSSSAGGWSWSTSLGLAAARLRFSLRDSGAEVNQTPDQRLWVSLPMEVAFAPGRSALKPAAGAWLDEVAKTITGLSQPDVQIVGQPDARGTGGNLLAVDRAAAARDWMVMRGVPAQRVSVSGAQAPRSSGARGQRLEILVGERAR